MQKIQRRSFIKKSATAAAAGALAAAVPASALAEDKKPRIVVVHGNDIPKMTDTFTQAGKNVSQLTDKMNQLDLQATLDNVNQTISSVHATMEQIKNPQGTLGKLMSDPSIYDNLNHTVQSADSLVTDLKAHPKRYVHFSVFGKKDK